MHKTRAQAEKAAIDGEDDGPDTQACQRLLEEAQIPSSDPIILVSLLSPVSLA